MWGNVPQEVTKRTVKGTPPPNYCPWCWQQAPSFLIPATCCLQLTRYSLNETLESCSTPGLLFLPLALHAIRRGSGGTTEWSGAGRSQRQNWPTGPMREGAPTGLQSGFVLRESWKVYFLLMMRHSWFWITRFERFKSSVCSWDKIDPCSKIAKLE